MLLTEKSYRLEKQFNKFFQLESKFLALNCFSDTTAIQSEDQESKTGRALWVKGMA